MAPHSLETDWKENIITDPPEDQEQEEPPKPDKKMDGIKADIIHLLGDNTASRNYLERKLDHSSNDIETALKQLQEENVIEKVRRGNR